ncbi:hypothetical protein [Rhodanobacter ginsengiterrae]|uniref:hypothetical protein n=1 Tax=Rhodanobacter ginsengiterrae TaxID=2008451 RepID=UPI003CEB5D0F
MWARLGAGIVPGFFLAAALLGLVSWLLPGAWQSTMMVGLLCFFPLWIGVLCTSLRFSSGKRAWLWLSGLALFGLGLLWLLQAAGWVR